MTTTDAPPVLAQEGHWRARPVLAGLLRWTLLLVPLLASSLTVYGISRGLPRASTATWWGLAALLGIGLLVAFLVERVARRLLPIALLLKLSLIFPDRAPSRLRLARAAAVRSPRTELLWTGRDLRPTSTSDTVLDLVGALGAHDRRTRGHSERVRLLTDMLAVELKLDEHARDRLRWTALLHDVGKVEVSARILNKPGPLVPAEVERMRLHPAAGAVLAAPLLPWLGTWGEGILDHHEKYDGSGYPNGKAGLAISPAGRLIGVIDAFETMTATRPYKKAMAARSAREELARCSGTHFDPVYVRAFLAISLPRLLWAMGPLSFLLQLPFLPQLAQTGARAGAAGPQTAGALAAGAAGAAAIAGGATTVPVPELVPSPGEAIARGIQQDLSHERPDLVLSAAPQPRPVAGPQVPGAGTAAAAPAPAAPRQTQAPRAAGPAPAAAPAPAPAKPTPRPAPAGPAPAPAAPAAAAPDEHPAFVSGPPSTTTNRRATFELEDPPAGTEWECQLAGAGDGTNSRWEPCDGRFTITVVRDGEHELRVRDVETRDAVDAWEWTVTD